MAKGEKVISKGPSPPDLSSVLIKTLLGTSGELPPPHTKFGDMKQDIIIPKSGSFRKGDLNRPNSTFWSANPNYDLLTEGTYAVVEMLQGDNWVSVYDDDDFSVVFKWSRDDSGLYSTATIEWEIPRDANLGVYRLRHFGSSRKTKDSPISYFTGASSGFAVA